jgi:hypothetical protein
MLLTRWELVAAGVVALISHSVNRKSALAARRPLASDRARPEAENVDEEIHEHDDDDEKQHDYTLLIGEQEEGGAESDPRYTKLARANQIDGCSSRRGIATNASHTAQGSAGFDAAAVVISFIGVPFSRATARPPALVPIAGRGRPESRRHSVVNLGVCHPGTEARS